VQAGAGGLVDARWCTAHFADVLRALPPGLAEAEVTRPELLLYDDGTLTVYLTPFDWVNPTAQVVIVGLTQGRQQLRLAVNTAADALRAACTRRSVWTAVPGCSMIAPIWYPLLLLFATRRSATARTTTAGRGRTGTRCWPFRRSGPCRQSGDAPRRVDHSAGPGGHRVRSRWLASDRVGCSPSSRTRPGPTATVSVCRTKPEMTWPEPSSTGSVNQRIERSDYGSEG
jgi:hypothetical protein